MTGGGKRARGHQPGQCRQRQPHLLKEDRDEHERQAMVDEELRGFGHRTAFADLFRRLGMGFDKPQPFVYSAGDFGENVSRVGIPQVVSLINGLAGFMPECGQRFGNRFHVSLTIGDVERVLFKA